MRQTVVVRRTDRPFVQMFCIEHPAFNARDFRADEHGSGFEIFRTMHCPYFELAVMLVQSGIMILSLFARSCVPGGSVRQSGIEAEIARFHLRCRRPKQLMGFAGRLDSRRVVSGKKSGLQLSSPIEEFG